MKFRFSSLHSRISLLFLSATVFLYCFSNCSKQGPVEVDLGADPEISDLIAPAVVYTASSKKHLVAIKAVDPQDQSDITLVKLRSYLPNGLEASNTNIPLLR